MPTRLAWQRPEKEMGADCSTLMCLRVVYGNVQQDVIDERFLVLSFIALSCCELVRRHCGELIVGIALHGSVVLLCNAVALA